MTGSVAVALGVAAVALASVSADPEPVPVRPDASAPAPSQVSDAEHCARGADALVEVADTITDAGGVSDPTVTAQLRAAEQRMQRRTAAADRELVATFSDLGTGLQRLRWAAESDSGVDDALSGVLDLVDVLDRRCQELRPR